MRSRAGAVEPADLTKQEINFFHRPEASLEILE
jgi:hypothetical protein